MALSLSHTHIFLVHDQQTQRKVLDAHVDYTHIHVTPIDLEIIRLETWIQFFFFQG